ALDPAAPANPLREARATTGLAIQADQASARPPQVVLSAVSPDGSRWTTDGVVDAVLEAVRVARARMVTLEHSPALPAILPAIHVRSAWLDGRRGLDFGALAGVAWEASRLPFLTEVDR
ncbi:hypothetical protein, partial [Isoptericola sp. QY 916]|uniref:hypothetical protein n=1 Tax=Isoptericola sp. QY 916 TaxID=2782570 RepID=UPI003D2FC879|nr:hypothetical protein [Isoptericola sp. QY 916]